MRFTDVNVYTVSVRSISYGHYMIHSYAQLLVRLLCYITVAISVKIIGISMVRCISKAM
jgi:hypothetical protein